MYSQGRRHVEQGEQAPTRGLKTFLAIVCQWQYSGEQLNYLSTLYVGTSVLWWAGWANWKPGWASEKQNFPHFAPNFIKQMFAHPGLKPCQCPCVQHPVIFSVLKTRCAPPNFYCVPPLWRGTRVVWEGHNKKIFFGALRWNFGVPPL